MEIDYIKDCQNRLVDRELRGLKNHKYRNDTIKVLIHSQKGFFQILFMYFDWGISIKDTEIHGKINCEEILCPGFWRIGKWSIRRVYNVF